MFNAVKSRLICRNVVQNVAQNRKDPKEIKRCYARKMRCADVAEW
jgi:hypothetical protein